MLLPRRILPVPTIARQLSGLTRSHIGPRTFSTSLRRLTTEPPEHLDEKEAGIYSKLSAGLMPSKLDVRDISGGCGSMYAVEVESPKFRGLTTLKMHRQVQEILSEDIKTWHGIQLKTKATPADES